METTPIPQSKTLDEARDGFLDEVGGWVADCIGNFPSEPVTGGHDEGTYTTGWEPYIVARGDRGALGLMAELRDKIRDKCIESDNVRHGYWRMNEAHHGTEHFTHFLAALWRLAPGDGETVRQFEDSAEHMGNWAPDIGEWFDWDTGVFRAWQFGTDGIIEDGPDRPGNVPDHIRCAEICLVAWRMTQRQRYLDLCELHVGRWADAILAGPELPAYLGKEGPIYARPGGAGVADRGPVGEAPSLATEIGRAENYFASNAPKMLLQMWRITNCSRFRGAAERLIDVGATQLADPDADPVADAIRAYRRATGDTRYDAAALRATEALDPPALSQLSIEVVKHRNRPVGIGKRGDMPKWYEDGQPRRSGPVLLALAAEITNDERLAARALDLGRAYLSLARRVFPSGREHGCGSETVSAVARGHGRNNAVGVTTGVLGPIMEAFGAVEENQL